MSAPFANRTGDLTTIKNGIQLTPVKSIGSHFGKHIRTKHKGTKL